MESHHTRPSRLEKQEEFEEEEDGSFMLSPVTIQIEDRDGNSGDDCQDSKRMDSSDAGDDSSYLSGETSNADLSPDTMDRLTEKKHEKRKASSRVKLLVRSHAVHDDASPPPDPETVITNTNMLSVTSAASLINQSKAAATKNRLGNQSSSQGSTESSSASGLSRDSSTETYTDSSGIDLQQFIVDTLHKNQKDRLMLLKVEQELTNLVKDNKRQSMKFPQMSSYNRMLVHRVAAYFGLDHYVDGNGYAVIVNKTKNTRVPDCRFQDFIRDELLPEEPKKSILKRDSISFEEGKEKSPERQSSTDSRRSKSFEEREEEYEKARARIFNQDEGLGESPLNRSQEGTYCSSRRSSQEDVRWPSSETKPWSSTDSDSSGRPLGSKLSSSFETETPAQHRKLTRSSAISSKSDPESKTALSVSRKTNRPIMTKASSFGGISVLARENAGGGIKPKITKAESFNVTTISTSPIPVLSDAPVEQIDFAPLSAVGSTATSNSETVSKSDALESNDRIASKDINPYTFIGQPLMWPYSSGTDVFYPGMLINSSSYPRVALPGFQPLPKSTDHVSGALGHSSSGSSSSSQSSQYAQPSSLPSHVQSHSTTVNTSSPLVFYVPYVTQTTSVASHQTAMNSMQNIRNQAQSSNVLTEPKPVVLLPMCYLQNTTPVHSLHPFSSATSMQNAQSPVIHIANVSDSTPASSQILSPQYMSCFPALVYTQSGEAPLVTVPSSAMFSYTKLGSGSSGSVNQQSVKLPYSSHSSQTAVCIQQPVMQLQTTTITSPPVYVTVTCSTHSSTTRNHLTNHTCAQFSSLRSQSLPVSSGSSVHAFNSGTPLSGYTVYSPTVQSMPVQSPITAVTITQNTLTSAASQFSPGYLSKLQVFQPNLPLMANIGNNPPTLLGPIRAPYPTPVCTVNNVPLSFPLVKQTSDPGIGEHFALSNNLCLIGPSVHQHLRPLLLPQQPTMQRFPRASISQHVPANRPPKTRKHRLKGSSINTLTNVISSYSNTSTLQSIVEAGGNQILEIGGLPVSLKRQEIEQLMESLIEMGAKIVFVDSNNLKVICEDDEFISNSQHIILAVFDSDTQAENALRNTKTSMFTLKWWKHMHDSKNSGEH